MKKIFLLAFCLCLAFSNVANATPLYEMDFDTPDPNGTKWGFVGMGVILNSTSKIINGDYGTSIRLDFDRDISGEAPFATKVNFFNLAHGTYTLSFDAVGYSDNTSNTFYAGLVSNKHFGRENALVESFEVTGSTDQRTTGDVLAEDVKHFEINITLDETYSGGYWLYFGSDRGNGLILDNISFGLTPNAVPLPAAAFLLLPGIAGLAALKRRIG